MAKTTGRRTLDGVELIAAERQRQVTDEGWDAEHDAEHIGGEISGAAASYAAAAHRQIAENFVDNACLRPLSATYHEAIRPAQTWRWGEAWWKPSGDPVRNLAKAGALIAAEIDRILRERQSERRER